MEITIRRATEADYPQVLTLIKEFSRFQGAPEQVTLTIEQMREDKDLFQCFIAEAGGEVAGSFLHRRVSRGTLHSFKNSSAGTRRLAHS